MVFWYILINHKNGTRGKYINFLKKFFITTDILFCLVAPKSALQFVHTPN